MPSVGAVDASALGALIAARPQERVLAGEGKMVVVTSVALMALAVLVWLLVYPRVPPINDTWRLVVRFVGFPILAVAASRNGRPVRWSASKAR